MVKKAFLSLCLGLGVTLGVFIALQMPPGGWGVLVGVLVGMLSCVFVLMGVFIALRFGNSAHRNNSSDNSSYRGRVANSTAPAAGPLVILVTPEMLSQMQLQQGQRQQTRPRLTTTTNTQQSHHLSSLSNVIEGQARPVDPAQPHDYFWE
jgi:hypothetical protein